MMRCVLSPIEHKADTHNYLTTQDYNPLQTLLPSVGFVTWHKDDTIIEHVLPFLPDGSTVQLCDVACVPPSLQVQKRVTFCTENDTFAEALAYWRKHRMGGREHEKLISDPELFTTLCMPRGLVHRAVRHCVYFSRNRSKSAP